ncbi:MAG: hypothetical protein WB565_01955 [Acidimicrobiales bacterium]
MSVEDPSDHAVDPADEQRHPADPETLWNESHYLDFVAEDGSVAGYLRIGLYPNLGVTWWTAMVVGPDRPVVASVAYDLPIGGWSGLELAARGFEVTAVVEVPLAKLTVRGNVPARSHSEPAAVYRGDIGETTDIGFDLEWTTDGSPFHYLMTTRYEVPCAVAGELTVGDESFSIRSHGQRDHSWGVRDWWAFGWCWAAARLDDGTRLHLADIRIPGQPVGFGYVQSPGDGVQPVSAATVHEELGAWGMPTGARARIEPAGVEVTIVPIAFGPLLLVAPDDRTSRFPRAFARFVTDDGRTGTGWIEWNQPEESPTRQ